MAFLWDLRGSLSPSHQGLERNNRRACPFLSKTQSKRSASSSSHLSELGHRAVVRNKLKSQISWVRHLINIHFFSLFDTNILRVNPRVLTWMKSSKKPFLPLPTVDSIIPCSTEQVWSCHLLCPVECWWVWCKKKLYRCGSTGLVLSDNTVKKSLSPSCCCPFKVQAEIVQNSWAPKPSLEPTSVTTQPKTGSLA